MREALYRTSLQGYDAGVGERYLHAMWRVPSDTGSCQIQVPTMAGLGGNHVLFLPSGWIAIRFSDADSYRINPMVRAAEHYRTSCR